MEKHLFGARKGNFAVTNLEWGGVHSIPEQSSNFVLFLLSQDGNEGVSIFQDHVEVGLHARKIFEELSDEKELLVKAVASLNMVRRKGKTNVSLLELEEDKEDLQ
ncbi:hypothetical protein B0H11DRAFT_1928542 [Mycena galericulata]|nr:hypothetical protein B0H11DRAFT_1928542 [Mycena galericulata]